MKKKIVIAGILLLAGCASELSLKQDVGPLPENYQDLIRQHMQAQLKDPYSAVYRFEVPYQGKMWRGLFIGDMHGWIVNAWINGKNIYGGYTGEQKFVFLIQNGRVVFRDIRYSY